MIFQFLSCVLVNVTEGPKETVIRGESLESDRKQSLIPQESHSKACPICRLNLKRLKYTVRGNSCYSDDHLIYSSLISFDFLGRSDT